MRMILFCAIVCVWLGGCSEEQFRDAGNRTLRNICQQNSQSCSIDCGVGKTADSYGQCR
jgi:hypothetical protein